MSHPIFATESVCADQDKDIAPAHMREIKKKFDQKIDEHHSRLLQAGKLFPSDRIRENFIKTYYKNYRDDGSIEIYTNPNDTSQKVVYIEYERNWGGTPYFTVIKDDKIVKWVDATYYGAISSCFWWGQDGFFYKTSTRRGSKATIRCRVREESPQCARLKSQDSL